MHPRNQPQRMRKPGGACFRGGHFGRFGGHDSSFRAGFPYVNAAGLILPRRLPVVSLRRPRDALARDLLIRTPRDRRTTRLGFSNSDSAPSEHDAEFE